MHDGQNLWAALPELAFGAPWNVDTAFDAAAETGACSTGGGRRLGRAAARGTPRLRVPAMATAPSGACRTFPEAIVIGVANTAGRIYEYTPTTDPGIPGGGGADLYLHMLVDELKPAIDGALRTRTDVGVDRDGRQHRLGGLVTAYAGRHRPDIFGLLGELSPST